MSQQEPRTTRLEPARRRVAVVKAGIVLGAAAGFAGALFVAHVAQSEPVTAASSDTSAAVSTTAADRSETAGQSDGGAVADSLVEDFFGDAEIAPGTDAPADVGTRSS